MYIIRKIVGDNRQRKYVAKQGSLHSYTANRQSARVYATWEEAENDLCPENESIIAI